MRAALVVFLLLMAGAAAAACGDDGDGDSALTAVQYFERLEAAVNEISDELDAPSRATAAATPVDDGAEPTDDAAEALVAFYEDFRERLGELVPPEELKDLHEEFVEAVKDLVPAVEERLRQLDDTDAFAVFLTPPGPELRAAFDRADRACNALANAAADRGLEVDLGCGEVE